jgi:hypothetical protein
MHESDAPDILAFLQAAEKWMGDELELSRATARRRPLLKEIGIESQPRR